MKEQSLNKSNSALMSFMGICMTAKEWADLMEIKQEIIGNRVHMGWSYKKILTTPVQNESFRRLRAFEKKHGL